MAKNNIELIYVLLAQKHMSIRITRRRPSGTHQTKKYTFCPDTPSAKRVRRVVENTLQQSRRWRVKFTADGWMLVDNRNHGCSKCGGSFYTTTTDYVPYGSTNVPMDSSEVCECVFDGCPSCGGKVEEWRRRGIFTIGCRDCGWKLE
jgi:hypothetical protein